jgi:hypothetical protein
MKRGSIAVLAAGTLLTLAIPARADSSSLAEAMSETYGAKIAAQFPSGDRRAVKQCLGNAMAQGIPNDDQALILQALNTRKLTPDSKRAIEKWIGGAVVHGPLRKPEFNDPSTFTDGKLTYADGTPQLDSDKANGKRMDENLRQLCPQYADQILKTGM